MYIAWIVLTVILAVVWLAVFVVGIAGKISGEADFDWEVFSACMAVALIAVFFHWIVLLVAVPAFFVYGLFQAVKLLLKKEEA